MSSAVNSFKQSPEALFDSHLTSIDPPGSATSHPSKERPGEESNKGSRWSDHPTSRQGRDRQRGAGCQGCCATCARKDRFGFGWGVGQSSIPVMEEEWSPAAATPPKAPATVPRPAPTYEQQIEIVGQKSETCRPGSAQCGGLKIRASAALPPNTTAAAILPPFIISLFCLLLSQSPSPGFGLRPHKSSFATTLAVAGIDVALLLVGTILIICVSRPPCFASSDSCVRSSPTISPISSFPQPCSLQQTSHTTSPFVPTYGSIDKLFLIISPAILAVPPSVRDVFTLDLRRIHLTRLLVR